MAKKAAVRKATKTATAKKPKAPDAENAASKAKPVKAPKAKPIKAPAPIERDDAQEEALFHYHAPKIDAQKEKVAKAVGDLRNLYKAAKADGLEKPDFDIAAALKTPELEAKYRGKLARTVQVAGWVGSDIGQLSFADQLGDPDRTPAADRAYQEGRRAGLQGDRAAPGYDPSTEQHRKYMQGFHEAMESRIKQNIKPPQQVEEPAPKPGANQLETPRGGAVPPLPDNVQPLAMTRAQFEHHRAQAAAAAAAEKAGIDASDEKEAYEDDFDVESIFKKKAN